MTTRRLAERAPLAGRPKAPGTIRTGRVPGDMPPPAAVPFPDGAVRLVGIDVGLARVSLAWFQLRPESRGKWHTGNVDQKAGAYRGGWWMTTPPDMPLAQRLAAIGRGLTEELRTIVPDHVWVEQPEGAGVYQERKNRLGETAAQSFGGKMQEEIGKLYAALGIIAAVCYEQTAKSGSAVELVKPTRAFGRSKVERLAMLGHVLRMRRIVLTNDNDVDAFGVALGQGWTY